VTFDKESLQCQLTIQPFTGDGQQEALAASHVEAAARTVLEHHLDLEGAGYNRLSLCVVWESYDITVTNQRDLRTLIARVP
jgi:hypothetical protein